MSKTSSRVFFASSLDFSSLLAFNLGTLAAGVTLELAFTGALNLPNVCFNFLTLLVVLAFCPSPGGLVVFVLLGFTLLPSRAISDGDAVLKICI
jgi:hypothetical protein